MEVKILYKGGTGEIVEKKSRFIANLFPVKTHEEAEAYISQMKKKYYDARHNCFAYVIGTAGECMKSSDDGEPSGTAGHPMLDVLTGEGICNALVVVTRYFGGTLLGTGGLVRAYSEAVKEGLSNCTVLVHRVGKKLRIMTDYNGVGKLKYLTETLGFTELECNYTEQVETLLLIPEKEVAAFEKKVTEVTSGKAVIEQLETVEYGENQGNIVML